MLAAGSEQGSNAGSPNPTVDEAEQADTVAVTSILCFDFQTKDWKKLQIELLFVCPYGQPDQLVEIYSQDGPS